MKRESTSLLRPRSRPISSNSSRSIIAKCPALESFSTPFHHARLAKSRDSACRCWIISLAWAISGPPMAPVQAFEVKCGTIRTAISLSPALSSVSAKLSRLKTSIQELSTDETWARAANETDPAGSLKWLVSDGKTVFFRHPDGFLDDLNSEGQRSFAFVVNLDNAVGEVAKRIPKEKREHYSIHNESTIEASVKSSTGRSRSSG